MRRLYVRIDPQDMGALVDLAQSERRHPADQAALLVKQALLLAQNGDRSGGAAPERGDQDR